MFPTIGSSTIHSWPGHVPPEHLPPEPPRSSAPIATQAPMESARSFATDVGLQTPLPERYASRPSGELHPDPIHPGLQIDEKGRRFISDGKDTYAVRFDSDNGTQRVYQPDNPAKPGIPVRQNEEGRYERHDQVGLKGGAPADKWIQVIHESTRKLDRAEGAKYGAELALREINAEIQRSANPDTGLLQRRDDAQRKLDDAMMTIAIEQGRIQGAHREIDAICYWTQAELADKQRHREDGRRLEEITQIEINSLQLQRSLNLSGQVTADTQNTLHKLQDDLRRIQTANGQLDQLVSNLERELNAIRR